MLIRILETVYVILWGIAFIMFGVRLIKTGDFRYGFLLLASVYMFKNVK